MLPRGSYSPGSGPIYLSELECLGSESSLTNCPLGHNLAPGLVSCNHSMDVSIQCQGIYNHIIVINFVLVSLNSYSFPLDYDECTGNNGGCDQTCSNTVGSFFCSCGDGYMLDVDMTSCNGIIIPA